MLQYRVPGCATAIALSFGIAALTACSAPASSPEQSAAGAGGAANVRTRAGSGGAGAGAAGRGNRGGAGSVSTQRDAPEGYCPGIEPGPQDRACWDGNSANCRPCYSPLTPRAACVGVGAGPAPAPLPICKSDADCARRGTRCEPGHPFANAQGCRPLGCDDGGVCPTGTVCDPTSPLANSILLKGLDPNVLVTSGCRVLQCADDGGPSCPEPTTCDPQAADGSGLGLIGCRLPTCIAGEACPSGYACSAGRCTAVPCNQPSGVCPAGTRCTPAGGCAAIHCSEPGAAPCEQGFTCRAGSPGRGCVALACDEPGASPCPQGTSCKETAPGVMACVECITNEDCGCGSCLGRLCFNRPGYCEWGCP